MRIGWLLVISPVRNEGGHLERVIDSVVRQTRRPDTWVLVDDGSTDETPQILKRAEREHEFIRVLPAPSRNGAGAPPDRLATAAAPRNFNAGARFADDGDYDFIAKLDGDVELPPEYFETVLSRFGSDAELGIACGDLVEMRDGSWKRLAIPSHHVHGALKCYSRACFDAIGGVQERLGWDTIDETYARMRGFKTRSFSDLVAIHHRPWASADGTLRGRARHGQCAYVAHFGFAWVFLRAFKVALSKPRLLSGLAFIYGYLRAAARRVPRVEDAEFRRFVRRELRSRVLRVLRIGRDLDHIVVTPPGGN